MSFPYTSCNPISHQRVCQPNLTRLGLEGFSLTLIPTAVCICGPQVFEVLFTQPGLKDVLARVKVLAG